MRPLPLSRSLRNKASHDMAFPHPQSRKDHYRDEDKPSGGGVVGKVFERTINITKYRNAKDEVDPSTNRTLSDFFHIRLHEDGVCISPDPSVCRCSSKSNCARRFACTQGTLSRDAVSSLRFTTLVAPEAALISCNQAFRYRTAQRTRHSAAASPQTLRHRARPCGR